MANNIYSSSKKWGIISLLSLIVILFIIYLFWDKNVDNSSKVTITNVTDEWLNTAPTHNNPNNNPESSSGYSSEYSSSKPYGNLEQLKNTIPYSPTPFDPNTASVEVMIANGVPTNTIKRIVAYRNKNGTFYNKEKLKNFGLDDETYKKIAPYISIQNTKNYSTNNYTSKYPSNSSYTPKAEPNNLDINTASQEDFMGFKGIGPGYSKRIVEYRDRLGGFLSIDQVKEVYGLPDSVYNHIKDKILVKSPNIKKININTATFEELADHPYIRKFMAENIIKFRNDIKEFKSIQELRQIPLINDEKYRKIVPYITL